MKSIYDIYEEVSIVNSTPKNTIGLGNPQPPTNDTIGSEPLPEKHKKHKKHKCNEGILSGRDNIIKNTKLLMELVDWLVDESNVKKSDLENYKNTLLNSIEIKDDVVLIDWKDLAKYRYDLVIKENKLPGNLTTLCYYNSDTEFYIFSKVSDLSNINIIVYQSLHQIYGDVRLIVDYCKDVKLGKMCCMKLSIQSKNLDTLTFNKGDNSIIELNLEPCKYLSYIYNLPFNMNKLSIHKNTLRRLLCINGIMSWSTSLEVKN